MTTPTRFRAETKYTESTDKKANTNLPIMATVGNHAGGGGIAAIVGRPGWYYIRLGGETAANPNPTVASRLTQCKAEGVGLVLNDLIFVVKARDRNLTYYEFHSFIQNTAGTSPHPILYARGIVIPDNVAQAFYIVDDDSVGAGSPEYLRIDSRDGPAQVFAFNFGEADVDFRVAALTTIPGIDPTHALSVDGASGNVAVGWAPRSDVHLYGYNAAVTTTATYYGGWLFHQKTAGVTNEDDDLYGWASEVILNQGGGVLGHMRGGYYTATAAAGDIGTVAAARDVVGILGRAQIDGATVYGEAIGGLLEVVVNTGNLEDDAGEGNAYGAQIRADVNAGTTVDGNIYGAHIWVDDDGGTAPIVYMLYLDEQTGVDYGIYQSGAGVNRLGGIIHAAAGILLVGGVIDVNGIADAIVLDANGDTSISAPTDDEVDFEVGGADVGFLHAEGWMGDTFAFPAKNTSGGVVTMNSVGYLDEAGEFKLSSVDYEDVNWVTVIEGGANNADIYVTRRGLVTIELTANCAIGDFLYMANSVGNQHRARPETYMRPEVFAVAKSANSTGAPGGTCSAVLYCHRKTIPFTSTNNIYLNSVSSDSDWRTTINGAPVGAVITYTVPLLAGAENTITPALAAELAHLRLYNETRAQYALISTVNTVANTITVTNAADIAAWLNGDTITARSQTCVFAGPPYFFDLQITSTEVPALATAVLMVARFRDTAAVNQAVQIHPWEAHVWTKAYAVTSQVVNLHLALFAPPIPLIQRRFSYYLDASGAGTGYVRLRVRGAIVAAP